MATRVTRRSPLVTCGLLLMALILTACSVTGDDDDDDASPTADAPAPTATVEPSATETPEPSPTSTATPEPTPTATITPTPTNTPPPSPTPLPEVANPFENLTQPDEVLENFTLSYRGEFGTPDGGVDSIEIEIEQSSPSRYHLRTGAGVEIWVIDDQTYFRNPDGSVFPIQSAIDPILISPAAYLIQIPDPQSVPAALEVGREDVEGRPATRYSVDANEIELFGLSGEQAVEDAEGRIEVWIDEELGFISRLRVDVTWVDENGEERDARSRLLVSNVGATPEIQPPV